MVHSSLLRRALLSVGAAAAQAPGNPNDGMQAGTVALS
jgi:hypothetical protein